MKVLVVAPHPDDDAIGCGGRIRQHVLAGDEVRCLYLTSGELGCPGEDLEWTALTRQVEANEACLILGASPGAFWRLPDGEVEIDLACRTDFAKVLDEFGPQLVYVTHAAEAHPDHRAAFELVQSVARDIYGIACLAYEVWTPMETFDEVVDISAQIGEKILAIRRHETQVKRQAFDEAAMALARFRGEMHNRPHGPWAEVFKRL